MTKPKIKSKPKINQVRKAPVRNTNRFEDLQEPELESDKEDLESINQSTTMSTCGTKNADGTYSVPPALALKGQHERGRLLIRRAIGVKGAGWAKYRRVAGGRSESISWQNANSITINRRGLAMLRTAEFSTCTM